MDKINMFSYEDIVTTYIAEKVRGGYDLHTSYEELYHFFDYIAHHLVTETPNFNQKMFNCYFSDGHNLRRTWDSETGNYDLKPIAEKVNDNIVPTYDLNKSHMITYPFVIELIQNYLREFGKRRMPVGDGKIHSVLDVIPETMPDVMAFSSLASASLVLCLWNSKINKYIQGYSWPVQCTDINKYLLDDDLAPRIGLPSEKEKYLDFYFESSVKMERLANDLPFLRLSNYEDELLANANLEALMQSTQLYIPTAYDNDPAIIIDEKAGVMRAVQDRVHNIKTDISLTNEKIVTLARKLRASRQK